MTDSSKTPRYDFTTPFEHDSWFECVDGKYVKFSAYQALEKELSIVKKQLEWCKEQRDSALHAIYLEKIRNESEK